MFLRMLDELRPFVGSEGLTATSLTSSGNLVRFSVEMPKADAVILGLPIAQTEDSVHIEILRIADGGIAERWSDLHLPVAVTSLASITWNPQTATQVVPAIERITMLRGSTMTLRYGTAHIVLVESGSLTVIGTPRGAASNLPEFPPDAAAIADAEPVVGLPGSAVLAAGSSPYTIVNDGPAVARALLIRIAGYALSTDQPTFGTLGASQDDVGVQIETLSASNALPNHKGDWTIEIGRATLAPGTTIPVHGVAGSELILVEEGALDAKLGPCGGRCIRTDAGAGAIAVEQTTLQVGQGISASDGATSAYEVASAIPATLLIVTVAPAQE
jgi:hypothetical protein